MRRRPVSARQSSLVATVLLSRQLAGVAVHRLGQAQTVAMVAAQPEERRQRVAVPVVPGHPVLRMLWEAQGQRPVAVAVVRREQAER